jgi:polyisoprenoid-binding protein YceI
MRDGVLLRRAAPRVAAIFFVSAMAGSLLARGAVFELNPAQTDVSFTLGDVLHTVHGVFKLKSGKIEFDPATGAASGLIVVDATSGASGGDGRDRRMHKEILESPRFPEVTFTPQRVVGRVALQGPSQVEIQGVIKLHGTEHPLALKAQVEPAGDHWNAVLRFAVPYVEWGLKNPSTFILRVSKEVNIDIRAAGSLTGLAAQ